jgi:putative photosynthetic complex assembly protein
MSAATSGGMPRHALVGAALLIAGSLIVAALGRMAATEPGTAPATPVVSYHDVRFADRPDGTITATLADGRPLGTLSVQEAGFTRGVMRGFARSRQQAGKDIDAPYRLSRLADGRFIMEDPGTPMRIELDVFGSANAATLARLFRAGETLNGKDAAPAAPPTDG